MLIENIPKKSLGQNFLIDKNIIKKIVLLNKIKDSDILEIGPGTGNLTNEILKYKPKEIILIENNWEFLPYLQLEKII